MFQKQTIDQPIKLSGSQVMSSTIWLTIMINWYQVNL